MNAQKFISALNDLYTLSDLVNHTEKEKDRLNEIYQMPEIVNIISIIDEEPIRELQDFFDKFAQKVESEF
jgi:hypothetical protein